jgi:hypothetical protein
MTLVTPEYLQTKTYSAMRDRLALEHGGPVQSGVWGSTDLKVTQRGAGANMSVDVALGFALIRATDSGNAGIYHVENNATVNVAVTASSGSNPRIDQIILTIKDSTDAASGTDVPTLSVLTGTASAGATLDNRTGAAALPNSAIRLADILVPTSSSTVTTANIRDRRPWARGAFATASGDGSSAMTVTGTTFGVLTSLSDVRIECSGVPLEIIAMGTIGNNTSGTGSYVETVDFTSGSIVAIGKQMGVFAAGYSSPFNVHTVHTPTAGSRVFGVRHASTSAGPSASTVINSDVNIAPRLIVREVIRPNTTN